MNDSHNLEDKIVIALRRITRANDVRSRVLQQGHGLTAPQLAVLRVVAQQSPVTPGEIARHVHLGQPTITGILARLAQRGLIARTRGDRDKRSQHVSLSEAGRTALHTAPSPLQDNFRQQLGQLHEWERTQILATLQRVADMMNNDAGKKGEFVAVDCSADGSAESVGSDLRMSADSPWTEVPQTLS